MPTQPDPQAALDHLAGGYRPGDADFAWTCLTLWRAQLAAVLDQPLHEPVTAVSVTGAIDSPSTTLPAAWLSMQLGAPADCALTGLEHGSHGIHGVHLIRPNGRIELSATTRAWRRCGSRASRCTTSHSPGAASATALPTSCAGSTPMSCTVR